MVGLSSPRFIRFSSYGSETLRACGRSNSAFGSMTNKCGHLIMSDFARVVLPLSDLPTKTARSSDPIGNCSDVLTTVCVELIDRVVNCVPKLLHHPDAFIVRFGCEFTRKEHPEGRSKIRHHRDCC